MHSAAERARLRRQQEEAEREMQRERARQKAAELEAKMKAAQEAKAKGGANNEKNAVDSEVCFLPQCFIQLVAKRHFSGRVDYRERSAIGEAASRCATSWRV